MAQIFISYAREDAGRVEPLAQALEREGYAVFWDRHIPAGKTWRSHIGDAIRGAGCVLVVWTYKSVGSQWVQEEAEEGKSRGVLIPVFLDRVDPPLGFRGIQGADLTGWQPGKRSGRFKSLLRDIRDTLEPRRRAAPAPPRPARKKSFLGRLLRFAVLLLALYLAGGLLVQRMNRQPAAPAVESFAPQPLDERPFEFEPSPESLAPPVITPPPMPTPVALTDRVFVVTHQHQGRGVSVVDLAERRVAATIPIPEPTTIEASISRSRRELYVALSEGAAFYFLDADGWRVRHVARKQVGQYSTGTAVDPRGETVYLATSGGSPPENKILELDARSGRLRRVVRIGPYQFPRPLGGLVVSRDGGRLVTLDSTSQQLVLIDAGKGKVARRVPTPFYRVAGPAPVDDAFYALGPAGFSKLRIEGWATIWHQPDVQGGFLATTGTRIAVTDARGFVNVLNDYSGAIESRILVQANAIAFSSDGSHLYTVAGGGPNPPWLGVFDVATGNLVYSIPLLAGGAPVDLEVLAAPS